MAGPSFVCKTDQAGLAPLIVDGRPAIHQYTALHDGLARHCGRAIADLFADPVSGADGGTISWYAEVEGEPQALNSLDPEKRKAIEALLREQLAALAPLLDDAGLRGLLRAAMYVGSPNDILVVGGRPLITNWGFVPAGVQGRAGERELLARSFDATLGRYAPFAAPDLDAADAQEPLAPLAEAVDTQTSTPTPALPLPVRPSAPASLAKARPAWRAPLVATVVAAAVLVLLFLLLPHAPRGSKGPDDAEAIARARELNSLLAARIASIEQGLRDATCVGGELSGAPALPPGDPQQVKPPPVGTPPGMKPPETLLDYLDNAVVLVVNEQGFGSGFFIGPKTIVTNYHVTQGSPTVKVVNRALRQLTPVTVRVHTPGTIENGGADFAVLDIAEDGPSGPPMALSTEAGRVDDVIVAGYPGITTQLDSRLDRLLKGDVTAIPEMSVSRGSIMQSLPDEDPPRIAVNTPISHGNSGGPLVDYCGRVLGVNTFGVEKQGDRAYYALSTSGLLAFLDASKVPYTKASGKCAPQGLGAGAPAASAPAASEPARRGAAKS